MKKNIANSLTEIHFLLQNGEPALRLNSGLISQIRMHTIVKLCNQANEKDLSKVDYIRTLVTVASVSNNLSWIHQDEQ